MIVAAGLAFPAAADDTPSVAEADTVTQSERVARSYLFHVPSSDEEREDRRALPSIFDIEPMLARLGFVTAGDLSSPADSTVGCN